MEDEYKMGVNTYQGPRMEYEDARCRIFPLLNLVTHGAFLASLTRDAAHRSVLQIVAAIEGNQCCTD
jgi:hypothetical protein